MNNILNAAQSTSLIDIDDLGVSLKQKRQAPAALTDSKFCDLFQFNTQKILADFPIDGYTYNQSNDVTVKIENDNAEKGRPKH
mmetsp:Transcript_5418/g.8383  ORF Transcript_5418/g.8383 Transcript_5418/m.8383 type:complete len:83 (+) Transcript_5418:784-1032(+)